VLGGAGGTTSGVAGLNIPESLRPISTVNGLITGLAIDREIGPSEPQESGVFCAGPGGGTESAPVGGKRLLMGLKSSESVVPVSALAAGMQIGGGLASGLLSPGALAPPRDGGTGDVDGVGRGLSPWSPPKSEPSVGCGHTTRSPTGVLGGAFSIGECGMRRLVSPLGVFGHSKSFSLDQRPASHDDWRTIGTGFEHAAGVDSQGVFCGACVPDRVPDSPTGAEKIPEILRRKPARSELDEAEGSPLVDSLDDCESSSLSDANSGGESERVELVQLISLSVRASGTAASCESSPSNINEKWRPICDANPSPAPAGTSAVAGAPGPGSNGVLGGVNGPE
jgi:hypothetical protein